MLRKIVNALIVLPLAVVFIVFAVANRHLVRLSFDPFESADSALSVTLPLFLVIIATAIFGVAVGGVVTWFGQHKWRRSAKRHEEEARKARLQLADLRGHALGAGKIEETQVPTSRPDSSFPVVQSPQYGAIVRDKSGATL